MSAEEEGGGYDAVSFRTQVELDMTVIYKAVAEQRERFKICTATCRRNTGVNNGGCVHGYSSKGFQDF